MCFLRAENRLLLIHRQKPPNSGLWNGIGGKLEPGEDPYIACVREVREETGLAIQDPLLRAVLIITVKSTGDLWVLFVFTAAAPQAPPKASDEGEVAWVEADRIATLPVPPDLPVILPHLFSGAGILTARFEYETEDAASVAHAEILGP